MSELLTAFKKRRSVYAIGNDISISDTELEEMIGEILLNSPTSYNMQSSRVLLLLGDNHTLLWKMVLDILRKISSGNNFAATEQKINSFGAGHGTVLYFDDSEVTQRFAIENQNYSSNFPIWAEQQNGMLQYAIWVALANKEIGASLQHYNPLIDDAIKREWNLPESWRLIAQMPFGSIQNPAAPKEKEPLNNRFIVR